MVLQDIFAKKHAIAYGIQKTIVVMGCVKKMYGQLFEHSGVVFFAPASVIKIGMVMILAIFCSVPAFGEHPLITDDTGTQGNAKYLLELNSEFSTKKIDAGGGMAAALTLGIADNLDLCVGFPYQWCPLNGMSDLPVEVKWRMFECDENGLSFALNPGFSIPSGDEKQGLGNGAFTGGLMLIVTKAWRQGAVHSNIGHTWNAYGLKSDAELSRKDIWHASIATEIHVTENLRSVFDVGIDTNPDKSSDRHPIYFIGGLIYSVTENLDIDFGVKQLRNKAIPDTMFLTGLTVNL